MAIMAQKSVTGLIVSVVVFAVLPVALTTTLRVQELRCFELSQCTSTAGCRGAGSSQGDCKIHCDDEAII